MRPDGEVQARAPVARPHLQVPARARLQRECQARRGPGLGGAVEARPTAAVHEAEVGGKANQGEPKTCASTAARELISAELTTMLGIT